VVLASFSVRGAVLDHAVVPAAPGAQAGARLIVEDGRIVEVSPHAASARDLDGVLLPGLIDLQVNGGAGRDVGEATPEALDAVAAATWRGGAVAFLPTLITAPFPRLVEQVGAIARWIEAWRGQGAAPLGIHLEGPFLEVAGAHEAGAFVDPTPDRIEALLRAARGRLALLTLAPGRQGAAPAIAQLRAAGVVVALGHSKTPAQFTACVDAGASMVTHLFNAMGALHHREPGIAGLALDDARVACSLICDGVHVHPAMVRTAFGVLGPDRTVLVTDAAAPAACSDGAYRLGGENVIAKDGAVRRLDGTLAGSALTMSLAVQRFAAMLGPRCGPWTLARVASANPARLLGCKERGTLARGARAECTLLRADGSCSAWRAP
jgi:N-acetylglucosamine-6-phosphate deacetylase